MCQGGGTNVTRILVVDGSELLAWRVAKVAPPGVEVERATTFAQAQKMLAESPPDAALFNLTPCHSNWRRLLDECTGNRQLIPFLCIVDLDQYEACSCDLPCRAEDLISEGLPNREFGVKIAGLINECGQEDPERFHGRRDEWKPVKNRSLNSD